MLAAMLLFVTLLAEKPYRVELHVHFDGAVETATLFEVALARNLSLPIAANGERRVPSSPKDIDRLLASTTPDWLRFDVVNDIIAGDVDSIKLATRAFVERQAASLARYTEMRYDPVRLQLSAYESTKKIGLTPEQVVAAVSEGLQWGMAGHPGVVVNQILCAMRGSPPEACVKLGKLVEKTLDLDTPGGVVGMDLAGDEVGFPNGPYIECFKGVHAPKTVHSGEGFGDLTIERMNMLEALRDMGVRRIGHGYAAANGGVLNDTIVDLIRQTGVHLEACPNTALLEDKKLQPGSLMAIRGFLVAGLDFGLSTDDPAEWFGNTSLTAVESIATERLGFTQKDLEAANERACRAAFGDCNIR